MDMVRLSIEFQNFEIHFRSLEHPAFQHGLVMARNLELKIPTKKDTEENSTLTRQSWEAFNYAVREQ
jgi:hypothetical protein